MGSEIKRGVARGKGKGRRRRPTRPRALLTATCSPTYVVKAAVFSGINNPNGWDRGRDRPVQAPPPTAHVCREADQQRRKRTETGRTATRRAGTFPPRYRRISSCKDGHHTLSPPTLQIHGSKTVVSLAIKCTCWCLGLPAWRCVCARTTMKRVSMFPLETIARHPLVVSITR